MVDVNESSFRKKISVFFPSFSPSHPFYPWLVLGIVMLGTFMVVLDGTIVNIAIPNIMASFGVTISQIVWISTAYLIALSVLLAISGWLSEHFGYKNVYIIGLLIFTVSSYFCGIAWNLHSLVFFRIIQGIGGGILMPVGMLLFTAEFPVGKRAIPLGFYSISIAAAISLGPSFGGYLIQAINWGWIFFINVPFGFITLACGVFILRTSLIKPVYRFDVLGLISLTSFLIALIMAISSGNASWNAEGWKSTYTFTSFFLSFLSLAVFIIWEQKTSHPIVDITIFKDRNFLMGNIILFIFSFTMFGSSFLLPLYFQNGLEYSTLNTGIMLLPMGLVQGFFSPATGWVIKKIPTKFVIFLGLILMGISYRMNANFTLYTQKETMVLIFALRGFSMALLFAPLVSLTLSTVPQEKLPQATGLFSVQRQIGAALGVAVFETIFTTRQVFHSAMYGSCIDSSSAIYNQVYKGVKEQAFSKLGTSWHETFLQAKETILQNIDKHVFVQAIGDGLLLAGFITFLSCLPLFFLKKSDKTSTPSFME